MLFQTPTFLIFLLIFLAGLPLFHGPRRVVYCCLASYVFYAWWFPPFALLLLGITVYAYYFGLRSERVHYSTLLIVGLGLLPLGIFKYTGFILENFSLVTGVNPTFRPDWALPIGISFFSFTAIAYVLDVRAKNIPAEKGFWNTALFFSFFPQLVAGPILRGNELLWQLGNIRFKKTALKFALLLFALGALKKVGIADQLAPVIDQIYDSHDQITRPEAILAFYGFAVQIYGDFSGYTDMALALGALLNVELPRNFDRPYMATSIRQFWQRWHMTLSRWFRDYLYIPLGGNRQGGGRTAAAIMITMILGGLWHGAAWNFIVWGAMHGALVAFEHGADRFKISLAWLPGWLRLLIIFHFVGVSWIFFRAPDFDRAMDVFRGFCIAGDYSALVEAPLVPVLIIGTLLLHPLDRIVTIRNAAEAMPAAVALPFSVMLILICAALALNNPSAFIYFDF